MKQENRHRIEKLVDINNFVFADPLLPSRTIGKPTHIAHICKSHKSTHNQNMQKSAIPLSLTNLYRKGIHGIEHTYRVYRLVQKLSDLEKMDNKSKRILEFCAIFHDIGRINDDVDDYHGVRSISRLKEHDFLGLDSFNNSIIRYIIENHCVNDNEAFNNIFKYDVENNEQAVYLLSIFKDADNLDRIRLGDFNSNYLRNINSKNLINFSSNLFFRTKLHKTDINRKFVAWITDNKVKI